MNAADNPAHTAGDLDELDGDLGGIHVCGLHPLATPLYSWFFPTHFGLSSVGGLIVSRINRYRVVEAWGVMVMNSAAASVGSRSVKNRCGRSEKSTFCAAPLRLPKKL